MTKKNQTSKNNDQVKTSKHDDVFKLVKIGNNKIIIAVGKYRVSRKEFDTFKQADEYIATKPYELIFNTCLVFQEKSEPNENKIENPQD